MLVNSLLLQTAASGTQAPMGAAGGFGMFLPLILIVGIMYFFMIRPQNKKQKELQKMLNSLEKGDKVITIGGIHGTVSSTKKDTVIVKVDDGTKIEFNRTAIASVVTDKVADDKKAGDKKEKNADVKEDVSESAEKEESKDE